jgi:predicted RNA binding protein YcfA (HicA-like mRNA interferase family)
MPKLPRVAARALIQALHRAGWVTNRQTGSHVHLSRPDGSLQTVVPYHTGDLKLGTLANILRDVGWTAEELRRRL